MFDFSFGELAVCLLVALVVLGPDKLHGLIRGAGRFVGQARSYMRNLASELERETELGEMRRQLEDTRRMFREHAQEFQGTVRSVQHGVHATAEEAVAEIPPVRPDGQRVEPTPLPTGEVRTEQTDGDRPGGDDGGGQPAGVGPADAGRGADAPAKSATTDQCSASPVVAPVESTDGSERQGGRG